MGDRKPWVTGSLAGIEAHPALAAVAVVDLADVSELYVRSLSHRPYFFGM